MTAHSQISTTGEFVADEAATRSSWITWVGPARSLSSVGYTTGDDVVAALRRAER
jgi:hypothetical protein